MTFLCGRWAWSPDLDRTPDGQVIHGEVYVAEEAIWLHQTNPEHELEAPATLHGASSIQLVIVGDVDRHYEGVWASGAQITYEPVDRPYGLREYGVRDPEGGHWSFAAHLIRDAQPASGSSI